MGQDLGRRQGRRAEDAGVQPEGPRHRAGDLEPSVGAGGRRRVRRAARGRGPLAHAQVRGDEQIQEDGHARGGEDPEQGGDRRHEGDLPGVRHRQERDRHHLRAHGRAAQEGSRQGGFRRGGPRQQHGHGRQRRARLRGVHRRHVVHRQDGERR